MSFQGWAPEALTFYQGLEADNSKPYWTKHKDVYESAVREPLAELLAEIETEFGPGRLYRPLRDTRFSNDKSPYKTAACLTFEQGGLVQISGAGLATSMGYMGLAADQLERYRASVLDDAKAGELIALIEQTAARGIEVTEGEMLKGAPRGYPKEHPRIDLLRKKDLYTWRDWPVEPWLGTAEAKKHIVEFLQAARPLHGWLAENVGDTDRHRPRRGE
jgi:uncharacterized protein (TIGR02453 family)